MIIGKYVFKLNKNNLYPSLKKTIEANALLLTDEEPH